jgi:hypothetical protein
LALALALLITGPFRAIDGEVARGAAMSDADRSKTVDEPDHPKGALFFMLIYLVTLALLWFNAYLRLWRG